MMRRAVLVALTMTRVVTGAGLVPSGELVVSLSAQTTAFSNRSDTTATTTNSVVPLTLMPRCRTPMSLRARSTTMKTRTHLYDPVKQKVNLAVSRAARAGATKLGSLQAQLSISLQAFTG
jgi:hypothetical protein